MSWFADGEWPVAEPGPVEMPLMTTLPIFDTTADCRRDYRSSHC